MECSHARDLDPRLTRTAGAAAAAVVLATTVAVAAPATADAAGACQGTTTITDTDVRTTTLVIGTKNTQVFDLVAEVKDPCGVSRVDWRVDSPAGGGSFRAEKVGTDGAYSYWTISIGLRATDLVNVDAGRWTSSVTAKGSSKASKAGPRASVLRASRVNLDARPEPVRRGKTITVTGKVERVSWETGRWAGYGSRKASLQWKPKGASSYTTVKSVTANAKGALSTKVKATKDGCYRFVVVGSATTAKTTSKGDCVDVR